MDSVATVRAPSPRRAPHRRATTRPTSRPTGRSSSRTTRSACTARGCTPSWSTSCPVYKTGSVVDPARPDGGVSLRGNSFSLTGRSNLPVLPHMPVEEAESYYGATVFPNMFIDVTGTSVIVSSMWPKGAGETTVVMEYLFAADTVAAPGFDPQRDRRVQRARRQAGLRRVRACATWRVVALLRPRSPGSAGPFDRRFPRHVSVAHDRLA